MSLTYEVMIDRLNAGDFLDPYDDVSERVLANPGLSVEWGRDQARSLAPPMIGACSFALNNQDGAISSEDGSSPWYQLLKPNRPFRASASRGDPIPYRSSLAYHTATPYRGVDWFPLFSGYTNGIRQLPAIGQRTVEFDAIGMAARLQRTTISLPLSTNIRTDQAVTEVLDEVGWPADKRTLSTGDTTLREWWVNERTAWAVLVELLASEGPGATMYEDPYGYLHFENRNYRTLASRSTTSQATFYDTADGGDLYHIAIEYDSHWEDIFNRATLDTKRRELQSLQVVWTLGESISPAAGTPIEIRIKTTDPFQDAVAPVLTTDYTVTGGTVSTAISWTDAASTVLTVTNTSGTPVVSDLQLRAKPYTVIGETTLEASTTLESDADDQTHVIAAWPEMDFNQAGAVLASAVSRYFRVRPRISITAVNADETHETALLNLRVSDRITVVDDHLGLNADLYIERIRYSATAGGRIMATFDCEPVYEFPGAAWDSAIWDTSLWGV